MDFIGIGFLLTFALVGLGVLVIGLFIARAMYRGSKSAASGAGNLLTTIEGQAGSLVHRLTPGTVATHGQMIDNTESLGLQLVSGGYIDEPAMEAFLIQVATNAAKMAKAKLKPAAPAAEVPAT